MATTSGSAERLQKASDGWRLEFQQLVYNSPSLLRPRRYAVQGEHAILQQLRELGGHEPLVRDTERLFRGTLPDGAYIVRDGRWFPELMPEQLPEPEKPPAPELEVSPRGQAVLEQLIKHVLSLETSVRGLEEKLDHTLATLTQALERGVRDPAVTSAERAATMAVPPVTAAAAAGTAGAATSAKPPPSAAAAPAGRADGHASIALPSMTALTDLVRGLAGPEANLGTSERLDWAAISGSQPVFFAVLQDHAGDEAGSMIFDLEAALRLAGALLMESEEVIESLLEEKVMSDEMLDAAGEVCNTLTAALNKVSGNPHVRAGKMQPFTEARAAQLSTVSKRDDYRYNQGGRLSLVAC